MFRISGCQANNRHPGCHTGFNPRNRILGKQTKGKKLVTLCKIIHKLKFSTLNSTLVLNCGNGARNDNGHGPWCNVVGWLKQYVSRVGCHDREFWKYQPPTIMHSIFIYTNVSLCNGIYNPKINTYQTIFKTWTPLEQYGNVMS